MNSSDNTSATRQEASLSVLLRAAQALQEKVDATLAAAGLSSAKFSALSALAEADGPLSLGELASRLSCVKSNMTQLVDRLEAEGLVQRVADATDRRLVLARITDQGLERQAAAATAMQQLEARFLREIEADDRLAVERLLGALA